MNRFKNLSKRLALMAVALLLLSGISFAQEESEAAEAEMPEMGAPEEMKQVAYLAGTWDVTGRFRMDANSGWQEMKSVSTTSIELDGAAQVVHLEGEMMGMPYKGMGVMCYSREYAQWQMIWTDNMGASMSMYTGKMEGDKIVLTGTEKWQGQEYLARLTTYNLTDKSYDWKYEMSEDGGKTWMTSMENHYVKRM